tara:strand:+ start:1198 stop:2418 length:1221 start_codon:yes stop_codon:yes gene_type:complete
VNDNEPYFNIFGLFLLLTYPGFYFYNKFIIVSEGLDFLGLRIFIAILGVTLLLRKYFFNIWNRYKLPIWYFIIFCSLPFFFLFLLFNNPDSNIWQINALFGLMVLSVFVGPVEFFILFGLGGVAAYYATLFINPIFEFPDYLSPVIQTYCALILYFIIHSKRKEVIEKKKLQTMKAQAGVIAHEMRTPLMNVNLCGNLVGRSVQNLETITPPADKTERETLKQNIETLREISGDLELVAREANNVINLLLANLKQDFSNIKVEPLSMKAVLEETMRAYIFNEDEHKVNIDIQEDFIIAGNQELLIHVFFNLLKNSLYFIHAAGKGEVFITVKTDDTHNIVLFKDTGPGIQKAHLQKLFTPFFTNSPQGTGIGLSFCKKVIESLKGTIKVESTYGEHTTFTMAFPRG